LHIVYNFIGVKTTGGRAHPLDNKIIVLEYEKMRIACVFTVKNEEETILQNIKYHSCIGVTDFYIFLNNSTDRTKEIIKSVPNLSVHEDLGYQDLIMYNVDKPELDLDLIKRHFSTHSTLRQIFHANMALELCKEEKIDWLIHLDPDELICVDTTRVKQDSLKSFLTNLDNNIDAVSFNNLEVIPTKVESNFVFEGHLFKTQNVANELSGWPKSMLFNPISKTFLPAGWFWGHSSGKVALRPHHNSYFTSSHECYTEGKQITSECLLHYNIQSLKQFLNKYKNFANYPNRRGARPLRLLLRDIVNNDSFSKEFLTNYFEEYILYSEKDIALINELNSIAIKEIRSVSDFFFQALDKSD